MSVPALTAREYEMAELIAYGFTNREIADELTISIRTVENHIASGRAKVYARDRYEYAKSVLGEHITSVKCLNCRMRSTTMTIEPPAPVSESVPR